MEFQTSRNGLESIYNRFLAEFRKIENETLKYILSYLKNNYIQSIENAMENKIGFPFTEGCGYRIPIPVKDDFPKTMMKDLNELETMNEKLIPISDGIEVRSYLITRPSINRGKNIEFCCQEEQFDFLLSLNRED